MIVCKVCFEIRCDKCTDGGGWSDDDSGGIPHFDTEAEGIAYAERNGFIIVNGTVLCPDHAAKAACAMLGHQWGTWGTDLIHPRAGFAYRVRYCEHCSGIDHDPPWDQLLVLDKAQQVIDGTARE